MKMYLAIAFGIEDIYYYFLSEEQWNYYYNIKDDEEALTYLEENNVESMTNCSDFCKYIQKNKIILKEGSQRYLLY